jgi:hypothetical protein
MFIRHNALTMMKNTNNSRQVIQAIEQGFNLIAQMIDSRVSKTNELQTKEKRFFYSVVLDSQCSSNSFNKYHKIIFCWSSK